MHSLRALVISLFLPLIILGCTGSKPAVDDQDFFKAWQKMAQESHGYSPEQKVQVDDLGEETFQSVTVQDEQGPEQPSDRPLPTQPVTLRLENPTSIRTVLHMLAKGVDQNLVISPNVHGDIRISLKNVPWGTAFQTILKNNGYTYTWEGPVLRVVTLEDLKKERQLNETQAQTAKKAMEAKQILQSTRITKIVKVKYADLTDIQKTLIQVLGGNVRTQETTGSQSGGGLFQDALGVPSANGTSKTRIKAVAPKGSVIADPFSNSLIIRAGRDDMDMVMKLYRYLDKPPRQIHIRAYIVETNKEAGRYLGIQWGGAWRKNIGKGDSVWALPGGTGGSTSSDPQTTGSGGNTGSGNTGGYSSLFDTGLSGQGLGLNFPAEMPGGQGAGIGFMVGKLGGNILEAQLSALEEKKMAHILSSPSITTMDHQEAYLEQGQEVPYESTNTNGDTNVQFKNAKLRLEIVPHVIDSEQLRLNIHITKDEVDKTFDVKGNPPINTKETKTSLIVHNNETVVISGLTKETSGSSGNGVPWLMGIPGLGRLFKGDSQTTQMDELLIFITPQLLKKRSEAKTLPNSGLSPEELHRLKPTHNSQALKWLETSRTHLQNKDWNEAVRTASIAVVLDPGLPKPYITRSMALLELKDYTRAYQDARTAQYLNGDSARVQLALGRAMEGLGHREKALEHYAKSCGLGNKQGCDHDKRLYRTLHSP